jgi:hypothetical protein
MARMIGIDFTLSLTRYVTMLDPSAGCLRSRSLNDSMPFHALPARARLRKADTTHTVTCLLELRTTEIQDYMR